MARLRRISTDAPPELLVFEPDKWPSWDAWHEARFEYLRAHPRETLNGFNVLDVIFEDGLT